MDRPDHVETEHFHLTIHVRFQKWTTQSNAGVDAECVDWPSDPLDLPVERLPALVSG